MTLRPCFLGRGEAATVTEQEFGEAVPGAQEIGADVFATAEQIASRFLLRSRDMNGRQRAGAVEHREVTGIAAVGFDAIAGSAGNQCRRNDVAGNLARRECALQLKTAGSGFVTAADRSLALHALDEAQDRGAVRCQRVERRRPVPWQ